MEARTLTYQVRIRRKTGSNVHTRRISGAVLAASLVLPTAGFVPLPHSADGAAVFSSASEVDSTPESEYGDGTRPFQRISRDTSSNFWILVSLWWHADRNDLGHDDSHMGLPEQDELQDWAESRGDDSIVDDVYGDQVIGEFDDELRLIGRLLRFSQNDNLSHLGDKSLIAGYSPSASGGQPISGMKDDRKESHDAWVQVVEDLPIERIELHSGAIVTQARQWQLSGEEVVQTCGLRGASSGDGDQDDDGVEIPNEYRQYVEDAAEASGFSAGLLAAQIQQESGWDPNAVSPVGAEGLTQFMQATWGEFGEGDPFDPQASIEAQGRYMADLRDQVAELADGDEQKLTELTLAAYNAGPGAVNSHGGIPPFAETEAYVPKIMSMAGSGAYSSNCEGAALGAIDVDGLGVDDYPYRDPVGLPGWGYPRSAFNHTQRQCTDFVMWRLNQAMGWEYGDGAPPLTFSSLGVGYGSGQIGAGSWRDILTTVDGIEFVTDDPQPGDIAWWGYGDIGGGYGHVGFVAEVDGDDVYIEHYNLAPNRYSATQDKVSSVPGFIRITDSAEV